MQAQPRMTGGRKAAILTLMLGDEASSSVLKHLREDEIERITREVAALRSVQPDTSEMVLEEFRRMSEDGTFVARGGVEYAEKLLVKALGPEPARRILDRVAGTLKSSSGFNALGKTDPKQLFRFLQGEQPQTIALILAHTEAAHAAQVVKLLPDSLRVDVLTRMASLEEISPDVVTRLSSVIDQRLHSLGKSSHETCGGVRAVAGLLNRLDRTSSQAALDAIQTQTPELATAIRDLMFVFEDLLKVNDAVLREIVQRADRKVLMIALKGTTEELRGRFMQNMSKRAGEMLREEMELLGPVRMREVEKAQAEIVAIARKLEEEGLLVLGDEAEDAYVT